MHVTNMKPAVIPTSYITDFSEDGREKSETFWNEHCKHKKDDLIEF